MRRLKASKGARGNTLTMFAEKYLVKKACFELSNETMKFTYPEPGPVEGKPTIVDVNLTCVWRSLARTAQVSTRPSMSWSVCSSHFGLHPEDRRPSPCVRGSARLHLELHMQETPMLYILWRCAGNDDKESIVFMSDDLSVDEEFVRSVKWRIAGAIDSVCPCTDSKGAK